MSKEVENDLKSNLFQGMYGEYSITHADEVEVQRYRFAVLSCGLAFFLGLVTWLMAGPQLAGLWLLPMAIGLGLALKWIHIYLRPLHIALQVLWGIGCLGCLAIAIKFGPEQILFNIASKPGLTLAIGPLFAALTGLGFKEFFCFRRLEAIGLTLLIPIALVGHLSKLITGFVAMLLLACSAILLLILALRKFGMNAAADIGDKSIFEYLANQKSPNIV